MNRERIPLDQLVVDPLGLRERAYKEAKEKLVAAGIDPNEPVHDGKTFEERYAGWTGEQQRAADVYAEAGNDLDMGKKIATLRERLAEQGIDIGRIDSTKEGFRRACTGLKMTQLEDLRDFYALNASELIKGHGVERVDQVAGLRDQVYGYRQRCEVIDEVFSSTRM